MCVHINFTGKTVPRYALEALNHAAPLTMEAQIHFLEEWLPRLEMFKPLSNGTHLYAETTASSPTVIAQ